MNITITQDNSRVEQLGSSGASIIDKLYELAIDPNNTLTLEGNISSTGAYGYQVDYLNTNYGPNFIVSTTNRYVNFHDSAVLNVLKNSIGDGTGVSETQLSNLTNVTSLGLVDNTNITDFREGCLLTNQNIYIQTGFINGCTNLDVVGIPPYIMDYAQAVTHLCKPSKIVISNWGNWVAAIFRNMNDLCAKDNHDLCTLNADNSLTVVKNIILPQGCDFHDQRAMCGGFFKSTVEEVTLPASVTRLADFQWSKIQTINFPQNSGLTKIFEYCFYECTDFTLDLSTLPQSITYIGTAAFYGCTNVTGTLNLQNITTIGNQAFMSSGITNVDLTSSQITSIGNNAFGNCRSLVEIKLPSTITSIDWNAFNNSSTQKYVLLSTIPPTLGNSAVFSSGNAPIYVPDAALTDYQNASGNWTSDIKARLQPMSNYS